MIIENRCYDQVQAYTYKENKTIYLDWRCPCFSNIVAWDSCRCASLWLNCHGVLHKNIVHLQNPLPIQFTHYIGHITPSCGLSRLQRSVMWTNLNKDACIVNCSGPLWFLRKDSWRIFYVKLLTLSRSHLDLGGHVINKLKPILYVDEDDCMLIKE